MAVITISFLGLLISFLGQLPLGNMNISSTQLAVQEGYRQAWKFALGIVLIELIYLRFALTGMDWIVKHKLLFVVMGWLTVVLFLSLGIASFISARVEKETNKGLILQSKLNRFWLGVTMSAVNPVQIPFWFIWSSYLIEHKILHPVEWEYNTFTIGAGLGTLLGEALYIHGGKWLIHKLKASNKIINYIMAGIFVLTALIQLYKMIYNPWTGK
ncbi:MAG: lysine transporter LysE [Chitinophagaceae bacterium]|nr:lysine transporter LysE [Chitinophagaceae bacterium]